MHTRYTQPGGEESVVEAERALLLAHGHAVESYETSNDDLVGLGRLRLAATTIWNRDESRRFHSFLKEVRPDVVHFHNTFPKLSPAVISVADSLGLPTVLSLHNFRLLCVNGLLRREGKPCEACVGKAVPWPGVQHGCYRDSRAASAVVGAMTVTHRLLGTWSRGVDRFVVPSPFARDVFVRGGLAADRLVVKPHVVPSLGVAPSSPSSPRTIVFVGRLSEEKGISLLLDAWGRGIEGARLVVVGDGPLRPSTSSVALPGVTWLGRLDRTALRRELAQAWCVVVPSLATETFGLVAAEAFAVRVPVVATRRGALPELVTDGVSGLLVEAEVTPLREGLQRLVNDDALRARLAKGASERLHADFSEKSALDALLSVYEAARHHRSTGARAPS